jgi:hypothetical protein
MTVFALFVVPTWSANSTRNRTAARARDETVFAEPSAVDELAIIEFHETRDGIDEPITNAEASPAPSTVSQRRIARRFGAAVAG